MAQTRRRPGGKPGRHPKGELRSSDQGDQSPCAASTIAWPDEVSADLDPAMLVELLSRDRPDYERGWRDGYRVGYTSGWDVGYGRAEHEHDEQWRLAATPIVELCRRIPAYADLERYRNSPHGELYERALARRGGREYLGGAVRWAS